MAQESIKKTLLSLSVAVALGCSTVNVFADGGDRVEELEARVAELEALVTRLLEAQEAVEVVDTVAVEERAEAIAAEKVDTMMAEYAAIKEAEAKKNSYAFGGYIKADVIYSDFSDGPSAGAGRDFYIPATIPTGLRGNDNGESYLDFSAKESRINFKSEHNLDNGAKMTTFFEMDFMLSGQGDERISNSYSPRVRHAFFTYNNWLFGQTWFTFFNVGALPENLDFVGPAESTIFGRQTQIRYTKGPWQFSAENPLTTVTPYGGGRIVADNGHIPDFVGRYNYSGDWGTFTVAGILRQLRYEIGGMSDSTSGYGISLSGKVMVGKDDFRWMASTGKGLGRYIGLNTANGAAMDANGNLHAITQTGVFGSYRHLWNDQWRSNLTLGYLWIDNPVEYTGMGVSKDASSVHVNLIYSPQPKLDFGVEFMYATRDLEDSDYDGDLKRVMFSAKYAY